MFPLLFPIPSVPSTMGENFFFFCLFRVTPAAYGGSQARGQIGVAAASLCHSHSNAGSLTHWARPGIKPAFSWILVGFVTTEPQWELLTTSIREIIYAGDFGIAWYVWSIPEGDDREKFSVFHNLEKTTLFLKDGSSCWPTSHSWFFFGLTCGMWKFLAQEDQTWATAVTQTTEWQCQILNLMSLLGTPNHSLLHFFWKSFAHNRDSSTLELKVSIDNSNISCPLLELTLNFTW